MYLITVLASGGGGNFQALIDNQARGGYKVNLLIVDRGCGSVQRAVENKITYKLLDKSFYKDDYFTVINQEIPPDTDLIVLAGFMPIIPDWMCKEWHKKIINTHPSLLPKYGGKGMYGVKVQEAVMKNNEEYAGCTVHYVNDYIDGGDTILQKSIRVDYGETPWQLGGRIFREENRLLVEAIIILKERAHNV